MSKCATTSRCRNNPVCGFSNHHAFGSKYSIISNKRFTIESAKGKLRTPLVFALLYSVQGGFPKLHQNILGCIHCNPKLKYQLLCQPHSWNLYGFVSFVTLPKGGRVTPVRPGWRNAAYARGVRGVTPLGLTQSNTNTGVTPCTYTKT